jgi:hypothetical protein
MSTQNKTMALAQVRRRLESLVSWRTSEQWSPSDHAAYEALCDTERVLLAWRR